VPWFLAQTPFHGKTLMTHATKAICKILLQDYVHVAGSNQDRQLYRERELNDAMARVTEVQYRQVRTEGGVKVSAYSAGHVFGACQWMVEIDGIRVLYTGDFTLEKERHLDPAEVPPESPDVLIIESTHGITKNEPRPEREFRFCEFVRTVVTRGGRCLIPIFSLGRVQELLLILDEFWAAHEELQKVPIFFGSNLTRKSMEVYDRFATTMSTAPLVGRSRFDFQFIKYLRAVEEVDDSLPCVVLAAPAFLQNGMSRQLFDRWASNALNGLIIPGYTIDHTLAKDLFVEPREVPTMSGQMIPRRIAVSSVSFSGHSDFAGTTQFIEQLGVQKIVLVHGVAVETERLRERLSKDFEGVEVLNPANCQTVSFTFRANPTALVEGRMQGRKQQVHGFLVRKGFTHMLLDPGDLEAYSTLKTLNVDAKQVVQSTLTIPEVRARLVRTFPEVNLVGEELNIAQVLRVRKPTNTSLSVQWRSDPTTDLMADAVVAAVTAGSAPEMGDVVVEFGRKLELAMRARWGPNIAFDWDTQACEFTLGEANSPVLIGLDPSVPCGVYIDCPDPEAAAKIESLASRIFEMCKPIELPR
jgi:cleavage and polyadenylation specificity factor subunit 3